MRDTAERLVERFSSTIGRLYEDTRPAIDALVTAGYPLPPELRAPAELALAQRFETEVATIADACRHPTPSPSPERGPSWPKPGAAGIRGDGLVTATAATLLNRSITAAVDRALADANAGHVDAALGLLGLIRDLDIPVDIDAAQESVFAALQVLPDEPGLRRLGAALDLAV